MLAVNSLCLDCETRTSRSSECFWEFFFVICSDVALKIGKQTDRI